MSSITATVLRGENYQRSATVSTYSTRQRTSNIKLCKLQNGNVNYHKLCNLQNRKSPSEIHYESDDDFSELEDIRLDNNESKLSNVGELNQHEAELDLVKFKIFVEIIIAKLKDRFNALTPKHFYKYPCR